MCDWQAWEFGRSRAVEGRQPMPVTFAVDWHCSGYLDISKDPEILGREWREERAMAGKNAQPCANKPRGCQNHVSHKRARVGIVLCGPCIDALNEALNEEIKHEV